MKVFIGCSGWNYKEWKGKFYPDDLAKRDWLEYYTKVFNTVEVNNTFYRLPKEDTVKKWKKEAPKDFYFTLKGSRYVTQMKKLHDVEDSVKMFEEVAAVMKTKLACILWQLPPNLHRDDQKLEEFCKSLKSTNKNVIEFRHESWFNEDVYSILKNANVSFCATSSPDLPDDMIVTNKVGYVRFHGSGKEWYRYNYSEKELTDWYEKISDSGAKEVYIYFNNDVDTHAPENARQLQEMFGGSCPFSSEKIT